MLHPEYTLGCSKSLVPIYGTYRKELVTFGLSDINMSITERKAMATELLEQMRPQHFPPCKPKLHTHCMTNDPQLDTFIGPRSWILLGATWYWFQNNPEEWGNDEEYQGMERIKYI